MKEIKHLEQELDDFNFYIGQLGNTINHSNINWKDEKYQEIQESIKVFATYSRKVLETANITLKSLHKFESELK